MKDESPNTAAAESQIYADVSADDVITTSLKKWSEEDESQLLPRQSTNWKFARIEKKINSSLRSEDLLKRLL